MAELSRAFPAVVAVLASRPACDSLTAPGGTALLRVAPREILLVGPVVEADVAAVVDDPAAVIEDVTDGWAAFALAGDSASEAFARLSELLLPDEGFVQGEVAGVAAKVLAEPGRVTILVPAMWEFHVETRIRADCAEVLS